MNPLFAAVVGLALAPGAPPGMQPQKEFCLAEFLLNFWNRRHKIPQ